MNLLDSKNSITVESKNKKVCTATYNKTNKLIIIEAVGEGSTEIVVTAKKGMLWWKKTVNRKISVTVNQERGAEISGISFIIIDPACVLDGIFV